MSSLRRLKNFLRNKSCKQALKTSSKTFWRRLEDVLRIHLEEVFGRPLANTYWRHLRRWKIVTLMTSSIRLQDVMETKKCLLGIILFMKTLMIMIFSNSFISFIFLSLFPLSIVNYFFEHSFWPCFIIYRQGFLRQPFSQCASLWRF